ncbi:MAG: hypothetical protein LUG16_07445, partial [Candidatus Gastranaerophilales bacterium]|nr:hypothetical protein [Candidatus Gastranaerophilales bacterium]
MYLLPKWEKIDSRSYVKSDSFFSKKCINLNLYRKFSSRNILEKYSIKTDDEKTLANMDLKIYKDCVFIINLDIKTNSNLKQIMEYLLQAAAEKALYNTTEKTVCIGLSFPFILKNKIKHILIDNGFAAQENQSDYEKAMFGENYILNTANSDFWNKQIKQNPIFINK